MPRRGLFPSEAFFGVHRGKILPSSDTWERITSTYRHRQTPGNAFRGHVLPCPTARWRTAAAYRQQSHPSAAQGAVCSFPPYPARAHPRDAAVPSCGGGHRRDEGAGALMRAAYLGAGEASVRAVRWVRGIDVQPTVGVRGHRLLARNPPERGHGSGARPTRTRACGCNSDAHTHHPPTRRAGAATGMHVGTEPSASRAPSVERGGIRPRAFAGARQCRRLRAIPASGPTALQEHQ